MQQPRTRAEFVSVVAGGAATSDKETKVTEKDLESLAVLLDERSRTCLARRVDRTASPGGQLEVSATTYTPTLRRISESQVEFTLQLEHSPRGIGPEMPEGGYYMLAVDLASEGPAKTRVELYYATMAANSDDIVDAVRAWTSGENADCPSLD